MEKETYNPLDMETTIPGTNIKVILDHTMEEGIVELRNKIK